MRLNVVSMSGGKDSTATAILALETELHESLRFVFADTGNEHEWTYEYALDYLPRTLGINVEVVKYDVAPEFVAKRRNLTRIANGEDQDVVYGGREFKYQWTQASAARALELLHPTGNPYLDLCMVRGGFPSRKRQFCTEYLKTNPLTEYALALIDEGHSVWSWQGVRADESDSRRKRLHISGHMYRHFEVVGGGLFNYRPIVRWNVEDVFEAHRLAGIKPNPLYTNGMSRVGCMPCINAAKPELNAISRRFPEHIERIAEWEALVSQVSRPRSPVSFFYMATQGGTGEGSTIWKIVEWSKTTPGGKQYDLLAATADDSACTSSYGLCE